MSSRRNQLGHRDEDIGIELRHQYLHRKTAGMTLFFYSAPVIEYAQCADQ